MRVQNGFPAQSVLMATLVLAGLSVFGVSPVRAQTPADAAQGPVRRISIDDAVALALENNLDLQVERLSPQIQDLSVAQVRTGYAPTFRSTIDFNDQTQPPASFLSGNTNQIVGNNAGFDFGLGALTKWGGNYNASFNNTRATTNNIFTNFNPQLSSNITLGYTQPLLRNFKIDGTRQQLLITQKNREISDVQLQQNIAITHAQRQERLLRHDVRGRQPQRAAPVARPRATVAQGQSRPRRDRHDGADRHRPGGSRSGTARGEP